MKTGAGAAGVGDFSAGLPESATGGAEIRNILRKIDDFRESHYHPVFKLFQDALRVGIPSIESDKCNFV